MNRQDGEQSNPAHSLFETFLRANQCEGVLGSFQALCKQLALEHKGQLQFYQKLKSCLNYWNAKALWLKLDKKAGHRDYDRGTACASSKCLIIGAGPCGLRTAIELAFLGAHVVLVEKRDSFSRNNVLHLWPFTIQDLKALGAKKFYGRFCTGTLDHISIRQLQLILLKVALLLGVEIHFNVQFNGLLPPEAKRSSGWRALLQPSSSPVGQYEFDILISAGGGKFVPEGFKRKEMRGKLAIGITTNFINRHSRAEVEVAEISGVARIYNQHFFRNLYNKTGIDLENIVYYKDDTHYFVMTAKKQSLLEKGVILQDKGDVESLLSAQNVNHEALLSYAKEAANFSTNYQLPDLEFALNHRNRPDVDMFDFTCMNRSENAALVRECHGARLLIGLVGDCLVEPFWPLGTGVARGFLAAFDTAWMVKRWAAGTSPLDVLAERESIYQQLSQTSPDNTNKNISQYSIDPTTRYPNINLKAIKPNQVTSPGHVEIPPCQDVGRAYESLLSWCQTHTAGYRGVTVTDFTHSWKSGLALCALIHRFRPDLLNFSSLDQHNPIKNNQMALDIAEQELGIPPVLSSTEMASVSEPNQLGLITYLSQFYEAFKTAEPQERMKTLPTPLGTRGAVLFLSKLQKSRSLTRKRTQDSAQKDAESKRMKEELCRSPGTKAVWLLLQNSAISPMESSDACYFCGKQVYILERVSAEGCFFHRGCFQCHLCGSTLRLGDYAFNEDDGESREWGGYRDRSNPAGPESAESTCPNGKASREDGADMPPPAAQPHTVLVENVGRPVSSDMGGRAHPEKPRADLGNSATSRSQREKQSLREHGTSGAVLRLPSPDPRPPEKKLAPPDFSQGELDGEDTRRRKKIQLSLSEKLELSMLNLTLELEPESQGVPWRHKPDSGSFRSAASVKDHSAAGRGHVSWVDPWDMGPFPTLALVLCFQRLRSQGENDKYPTWKRTLLRRAKEADMKRFCKAQAIQRRLEEIEVAFRELEAKGIQLERALRGEGGRSDLKTRWMNQLLALVQKKNSLVSEESDLMIEAQELKLEEEQCQLDQKLRQYMNMEESLKMTQHQLEEKKILAQLLEVVNKRNELIHVLEEKRLNEQSQALLGTMCG
uniref:Molecule interacting with CasL protein 1 n=1 Tax=Pelusios castaneus TaxID=367368 RepID=A0A8C8S2E7_9SAUR